MGALLAFQPAGDGTAFGRARAWIEEGKCLPLHAEAGGRTRLAAFGRTEVGRSPRGWLASAGAWTHPDARDADALLAAVEARPAALDALDGFYAVLWHDEASGTLTVAPDHLGRLHLFAAETADGAWISTSAVALARVASAEPDPLAVAEFLASGTLYEDRTPFLRVRRLRAGRRYRFRAGRAAGVEEVGPASGGDIVDACRRAAGEAAEAAGRPLPDLTGGLDSRLVVGFLLEAGHRFPVTVTGAPGDPDVRSAARLARALGVDLVVEDAAGLAAARADFAKVRRAAARAEGGYDAIEYAGIAHIHEDHAARWGGSVNGSGGEVLRNYWWGARELAAPGADAVAVALPRFARPATVPAILAAEHRPDPWRHFREVLGRSLEGRGRLPAHERLDHLYLDLRMQCWQGAIASATNQIWPTLSPLLDRRVLAAVLRAPPRERLGGRLLHALFARWPGPLQDVRLATGGPPRPLTPATVWRFLPALAGLARRARARLLPPRGAADAPGVRALLQDGAADFLAPAAMRLLPLLDRAAFEAFRDEGARSGEVSSAVLGRLLALEFALRGA